MSGREFHWRIGGQDVLCRIEESQGSGVLHASGQTIPFRRIDSTHVEISGRRHRFYVLHRRDTTTVWIDGHTYFLQRATKAAGTQPSSAAGGEIRALMPGKLLRLVVAVGDQVTEKQPLAIMESMKMESTLVAPKAGRVVDVRFKPGDVLEMGDVVVVLEGTNIVRSS
jgi:biotin carboxyl carrier protein